MQQCGDSSGVSWERRRAVGVKEQSAGAAYQRDSPLKVEERIGLVLEQRTKTQSSTYARTHILVHLSMCVHEYTHTHTHVRTRQAYTLERHESNSGE